jgi:hypothetical protein
MYAQHLGSIFLCCDTFGVDREGAPSLPCSQCDRQWQSRELSPLPGSRSNGFEANKPRSQQ